LRMIKETQIVETVSGSWLRFPNGFKKLHCLIELPNQLSLNINVKSGSLHVHKKDSNNIYQYLGELLISSAGKEIHCSGLAASLNEAKEPSTVQQSDAS
jgi:hypothetical protein